MFYLIDLAYVCINICKYVIKAYKGKGNQELTNWVRCGKVKFGMCEPNELATYISITRTLFLFF